MKEFKYNNAILRIHGKANLDEVEKAATIFMAKAQRSRRKNGNNDKTRSIGKKQVLDRQA